MFAGDTRLQSLSISQCCEQLSGPSESRGFYQLHALYTGKQATATLHGLTNPGSNIPTKQGEGPPYRLLFSVTVQNGVCTSWSSHHSVRGPS